MNTNDAIATLSALKATMDSNIAGFQAQSDALGVSITQLQGTLDTEAADIAEAVQAATAQEAPPAQEDVAQDAKP